MRNIAVAIVVGLAVGTAVTPAQAAPPTQDSVEGNVRRSAPTLQASSQRLMPSMHRAARAAKHPQGTVRATEPHRHFLLRGHRDLPFDQRQYRALNLQTGNFGLLAFETDDNAGTGFRDLVEATLTTRSPTECSTPQASYIRHDRVTAGDIVIHDAAPLPSSKEPCRNGG